jgi:hypothetical protein
MCDPMMNWDDKAPFRGECVWWSRLDGKYQVEVHRTSDPYRGCFHIYDHDNNMKHVHSEPVTLSYSAMFGPDVEDVRLWEELACRYADGEIDDK